MATTSQRFLKLLAARDFDGLAATLASDTNARFLLPHGLEESPGGIERMDLLCSGFQMEAAIAEGAIQVFEAGAMGCADGLAQEFRRRLTKVPVGGSLEVVVSDPSAKEDLPSLARLLGQRVTSTEAHDDGRLTITVERQK